jgi:hypothetical protein
MKEQLFLETPDDRYIIVRGRLWRKANPNLPEEVKQRLVSELMSARRAVREAAGGSDARSANRGRRGEGRVGGARAGMADGWRAGSQPAPGKEDKVCEMVSRSHR